MIVGQRPQQHIFDHAENCCVRAYPQRQREHRDDSEARIPPQGPEAKPHVVTEITQPTRARHVLFSLSMLQYFPLYLRRSDTAQVITGYGMMRT